MKTLLIASVLFAATSGAAFAAEKCDVPTSQWQPREALQSKLEKDGWTVRQIKAEDGCYEAYAVNAAGKRMEALFNPKTLEAVGEDSDQG